MTISRRSKNGYVIAELLKEAGYGVDIGPRTPTVRAPFSLCKEWDKISQTNRFEAEQ